MALLEMRGICKRFPGIIANDNVNLTVEAGQIHALLGENGAGKTTLMNILYGLYQADKGAVYWNGKQVQFASPIEAIKGGVGMVHQHFMLVQKMTALQNIILGLRIKGYPFVNYARLEAELGELSKKYGLPVNLHKRIDELAVGEQQRVEILKALYRNAKLLILDEPTAVLTPQETEDLFGVLRMLRAEGHSIILISHKLNEILAVSDIVTVLRDGRNAGTIMTARSDAASLSRLMIGREPGKGKSQRDSVGEHIVLETRGLTLRAGKEKPKLNDVSFVLREREILGIAGVDGNGQSDLAEVLCGIKKQTEGELLYDGNDIGERGIRARFNGGIAFIPDDRHRDGLVLDADIADNLLLRLYYAAPYAVRGVFRRKQIAENADKAVAAYQIKTPGIHARAGDLSGGNQQKIILARELGVSPRLLVAMQPTRGLDIGASEYVREQLFSCRDNNRSVLLISTDIEEIMMMSDRIAVMYEGRIMGILDNKPGLDPETIGLLMGGRELPKEDPA